MAEQNASFAFFDKHSLSLIIMKRKFLITTLLTVSCLALSGQGSIPSVLDQIEANNKTLAGRASLARAETLEARVGNSLSDPEVAVEHVWGTPAELGKHGEFVVSQSFDFPTAYIARNRLAKMRGRQAESGYNLYRQQVLLEAQELCYQVIALRRQRMLLEVHADLTTRLADAADKELEAGEANILKASEARVHALSAGNAVRSLDIEIADALGQLKILNGGAEVTFPDSEFPSLGALTPFDEMVEIYLDADPALTAALAERTAEGLAVKAARAESLPKLVVGYKLEFAAGERFNGLVAGLSIPMFGNRNNVKAARAREIYAASEAENIQNSTRQRLETLYAKAALLEESINSCREITTKAGAYIQNLAKALEAGEITITDYFWQYDEVLGYQQRLIELQRDYHLVCARINAVTL
jgi:outer membrane protein TolC